MKRMIFVVFMLVLLSLACATLTGVGNSTNTSGMEENNMPAVDDPAEAEEEPPAVEEEPPAAPVPDSACYNPFYPLAAGGAYTYRLSYSDPGDDDLETEEFQIVTVGQTEETLTVQSVFDEFSSEVEWVCGTEGLFSTQFAQFDFAQLGEIEIETVGYDGLSLPAEEMWYEGSTWDMDYEINMSYSVEGVAVSSHVIGDLVNEITTIESVTVPAGTYPEAYRLETTGTITMETEVGGSNVSIDMPTEMVTWYVKGVGMVKQDASDENGTNLTELIAIE